MPSAPALSPVPALDPRARASSRVSAWSAPAVLAALMVCSAGVRGAVAVRHSVPRYFPDEYVYASLGRALAHGNLTVRGATAHFPAIVEPLLAAPLWGFFGTATAYHLVQVENAVIASLAAIPIYAIARWLALDRAWALLCAAVGLALPQLTLAAYVVSDPVAYPLILATVLVALHCLERPTRRGQLLFLGLAIVSTLTRVEYALVVPAYLVAALVLDRRRAFRAHRLAFASLIPVTGAVTVGALGYYFLGGADGLELHPLPLLHWFVLQGFLLTVASGVVIVPCAVAALVSPEGRREAVYTSFSGTLAILILAAASEPAAATDHFKQRYLFALTPLIAIAFALYTRRNRKRWLVFGLAAALVIAIAKLPMSAYTASTLKTDSQFLFGVWYIQRHLGVATTSLVVAVVATGGCAATVAVARGRLARTSLVASIVFLAVFAAFSTIEDLHETDQVRAAMPASLNWVDKASAGAPVTAVATTPFPSGDLREELFWNTSIQREVTAPGAVATDVFNAPDARIDSHGTLTNVNGDLLFDDTSATGLFADASRIAHADGFSLWRPAGRPRFRLLITNRYPDGWLGYGGTIQAWPLATGRAVSLSFALSVPQGWHPAKLLLGHMTVAVRPGHSQAITCRSSVGPVLLPYSSPDVVLDQQFRHVIVRMTRVRITDTSGRELDSGCTVASPT